MMQNVCEVNLARETPVGRLGASLPNSRVPMLSVSTVSPASLTFCPSHLTSVCCLQVGTQLPEQIRPSLGPVSSSCCVLATAAPFDNSSGDGPPGSAELTMLTLWFSVGKDLLSSGLLAIIWKENKAVTYCAL